MTASSFRPMPPVGPPPNRFSPPAVRPPSNLPPLPHPPASGSATFGTGQAVTGSGKRHKIIYRVGTTAAGLPPLTTQQRQEVLDYLKTILDHSESGGATAGMEPQPPTTTTLTVVHEPQAVE